MLIGSPVTLWERELKKTNHNQPNYVCSAVNTREVDIEANTFQPIVGRGPQVNWYPGHIAKAERQLKEQLKLVDVVLEIRDARIPISTTHPQIQAWIGEKPKILVMNKKDMISKKDMQKWSQYFGSNNQEVCLRKRHVRLQHGCWDTSVP